MTSKSARIRALYADGKSTREIAISVYRLPANASYHDVDRKAAYVRVVLRQRQACSYSAADERWLLKTYGGRTVKEAKAAQFRARYASDPKFREAQKSRQREWYVNQGGREYHQAYYRRRLRLPATAESTS